MASQEQLHIWMPWAQQPATAGSVRTFLFPAADDFGPQPDAPTREWHYAITRSSDGAYLGGCGLLPRIGHRAVEIGYWVHTAHTGRGIGTVAARLLTTAGLGIRGVERVEIRCDEANLPSAAIPRKLGYRLERIIDRAPQAPGHTGRGMVWVMSRRRWSALM